MRETLQEIVAKSVPPQWLREVYGRFQRCYEEAFQHVANYPLLDAPERRHILPYLRRGLVEADARRWALDCGMHATVEDTETESHQFTFIRTGQICFTISKTTNGNALPTSCGFRKQHSHVNNMLMQQAMFPVIVAPAGDEDLIYAIITHGPTDNGQSLGFVSIGFPNSEMTGWAEPPVSIIEIQERQTRLFQKPELDLHEHTQEEQRTVPLKKDVRKKKDDEEGLGDEEGEAR